MCKGRSVSDVLFVCTGNLCRSPSAALLLQQELASAGTTGVTVHSAGVSGTSVGPPAKLLQEAGQYGLNLGDHVPRQLDGGMLTAADLIVAMSREHLREIVLANRDVFSRTFTLREIVRRGQDQGQRNSDESLQDWLARLHEGRRTIDLVGDSREDDIADPMGGSADDYRRMLKDVSALTQSLRHLAWPTLMQPSKEDPA
jgi:protein-tyrosine phosphatase